MKAAIGGFFKNLLVWSYDRGTLQYDIICALILAFVFFVPPSCFAPRKPAGTASRAVSQNSDSHNANKQLPADRRGRGE